LAAAIRLYLDENLSPRIADQLRRRGVDIVTVHDLDAAGDSDENHLFRATRLQRVLVTTDVDFLVLAGSGQQHAGIVFGEQATHKIGDWVNALDLLCAVYAPEEMANHVEYI
jgi:predicted nuclease of predicted toxin-antitoxin system